MKKTLLTISCFLACTFSIHAQILFGITGATLSEFDTRNNILTTIKSFVPAGSLLQATDGKIYGATIGYGGIYLFSFDAVSGNFVKLMDFDGINGGQPGSSLMQASDGLLYGMTHSGGSNGAGVIYSFDLASSTYTKLKDFDGTSGVWPSGSLIQASDGLLYGMTFSGGSNDAGVIFSFDPASSTYTNLKDFDGTSGKWPHGSLMQASDGKLYGMTVLGGGNDGGVIFSYDPASSTYTKLKDLPNGFNPRGNLIQASDGKLYGTSANPSKYGVIFSYDPISSNYTKLKDLDGIAEGSLMQASDGKLYGMAYHGLGGSNPGRSFIFSYDPISSNYTKLKDFDKAINSGAFGRTFIEVDLRPVVNITSPANNSLYPAPGSILLTANATDGRKIRSVSFYNGSTLIFNETTAPYSRTWHNVPLGDYTITAVSLDDKGVITTSAPVQVHVVPDKPPVVTLTSPADDASFAAPGDIVLTADASDPDGKIRSVSFYNGSALIFNETTGPYSRTWHKIPLGDYTITAVAMDNGGNKTTSAPVIIHVVPDKPPVVTLTSPADGATFTEPGNILLTANATDDRKIRSASFYYGSTLIFNETTAPYSRTWHNVPAGDYTITAVALDDAGNKTTSSPVQVHVGNLATLTTAKQSLTAEKDFTGNVTLTLAPNPANNILNIHTTGLENEKQVSVSVMTSLGLTVQTKQITGSVSTFQLDVSHLAKGVYTIQLMSDKKVVYKQFVKM